MGDDIKVNKYTGDDGRRVEQKVIERVTDGKKQRIVETHVEQVPVALEERVIETIVPIVTERKKETFSAGQLVDTHIERVADESLHMQDYAEKLTKEDITHAVKMALSHTESAPLKAVLKPQASISDNIKQKFKNVPDWVDYLLYIIISGNAAFVIYQLFLKNHL